MGNLKDIQDITGLTSEAIFNIRKPVDYMCGDRLRNILKINRYEQIIIFRLRNNRG